MSDDRQVSALGKFRASWVKRYRAAEKQAKNSVPFYVTDDGGLFANPREVIRSANVRVQLEAFSRLQKTLSASDEKKDQEARALS